MPRLPLGYTATENGVVGPAEVEAFAQKVCAQVAEKKFGPTYVLSPTATIQIEDVPAEEQLRGSTEVLETLLETHPDLEGADDPVTLEVVPLAPPVTEDLPEDIMLLMAGRGYTVDEAYHFKYVLRTFLDEGLSHTEAVFQAEDAIHKQRAETIRQAYLVGYQPCEPQVTVTMWAAPEPAREVTECPVAAPVMERVKRRRGEEKLVHISTAVPPEVKAILEQEAEANGVKLGAYVRHCLETRHS